MFKLSSYNAKLEALKNGLIILFISLQLPLFVMPVFAAENSPFRFDLQQPVINLLKPAKDEIVMKNRPLIEVEIKDEHTGISKEQIILSVNGVDVTMQAQIEPLDLEKSERAKKWLVRYYPTVALPDGKHLVQVDVVDREGRTTREIWSFQTQTSKPDLDWDLSLNNTLSYAHIPLQKLQNASNFAAYLQLSGHRFTVQLQSNITDYPGLVTEPNLGNYYFRLDQYTLDWQNRLFTLQHGNVNLPFQSSLLQFGLGFKGTSLKGNQSAKKGDWLVFNGTTGTSFGLGIAVIDSLGVVYKWQKGLAYKQVYLTQLGKGERAIKAAGFMDERVFTNGILHTEIIYGHGNRGGGSIRLQGATKLANIYWDGDFILMQDSYPLATLSPLSNNEGGAYHYSLGGNKLFTSGKKLNFAYSQTGNDLSGRATSTQTNQVVQAQLKGNFSPHFSWTGGYQMGRSLGMNRSVQHLLRAEIYKKINVASLSSSFSLTSNTTAGSRKYQWQAGYSQPFQDYNLTTTSTLQLSSEVKDDGYESDNLKLRFSTTQKLFDTALTVNFAADYQFSNQKDLEKDPFWRSVLGLSSSFNLKTGKNNTLGFSGKVSFWSNNREVMNRGTDYTLGLVWQTKLF